MHILFQTIGSLTAYNIIYPKTLATMSKDITVTLEITEPHLRLLLDYFHLTPGNHVKINANRVFHKFLLDRLQVRGLDTSTFYRHRFYDKFDLIHINSVTDPTTKSILQSKKPKILTYHQIPRKELITVSRNVDAVVASSNFSAKVIKKVCDVNPKIIPLGVDPMLFNPSISSKAKARKSIGLPQDCPVILWSGRVVPEKNLLLLLDAIPFIAKNTRNVVIYIHGFGANKNYMRKEVIPRLRTFSKLYPVVRIMFRYKRLIIPYHRIPYLYKAADVFVHTSYYETFGLALAESMACGTPVITTNYATGPEIVGDSGLVLVENEPEELGDAIVRVLTDKKLSRSLSAKALKRIHEKGLVWSRVAARYREIYEEVLNSRT